MPPDWNLQDVIGRRMICVGGTPASGLHPICPSTDILQADQRDLVATVAAPVQRRCGFVCAALERTRSHTALDTSPCLHWDPAFTAMRSPHFRPLELETALATRRGGGGAVHGAVLDLNTRPPPPPSRPPTPRQRGTALVPPGLQTGGCRCSADAGVCPPSAHHFSGRPMIPAPPPSHTHLCQRDVLRMKRGTQQCLPPQKNRKTF